MQPVALVVGEALVDVVHRSDDSVTEFPGGSAANAAVALSRLGRATWFHTCFVDDHYGRMLRGHLESAGVELASDPAAIDHSSSAVATIGPDGGASYVFDISWHLNPLDLPDDVDPVMLHTSSLAAVLSPGAEEVLGVVTGLRDRALVSYDVNARPAVTGTGPDVVTKVERLAAVADVLKASDEDLEALYPERSVAESSRALLALGPSVVVVTRGGDGADWFTRDEEGTVAAVAVAVADTIGAGDTFGAALLDALWERGLAGAAHRDELAALPGDAWRELIGYAVRAAAVTVSRPGADPPHRHELD
ncbi:PfkB family carbohydrate kinase [Nocardioides sp.]|uniref:PfkB family carbohydrate kinase n=1 Tax=Nocardioides sp. TaxID=35761 RepID=UPI0035288826